MCDFGVSESIALAGVVASMAAAGASYAANQQQVSAQKKAQEKYQQDQAAAMEAARQKQNKIEEERNNQMQTTYKNYDPATQAQQQSQIADDLNNKYSSGLDNLVPGANLQGSDQTDPNSVGQKAVSDTYKNSLDGLGSYLKQQAKTRASLDAFGNQMVNNNIFNTHAGQNLSMFDNFAGGNGTTLNTAMQGANLDYSQNKANAETAGAGLSTLSSVLGGLGSAATSYGTATAGSGGSKGTTVKTNTSPSGSMSVNYAY